MNVRDISIGELAERAGCTVQIIRHYEKIGLLPDTRRTSGNRRIYSEDQASRLIFIRHSRELGFSLDDIRQLLSFSDQPEQSCDKWTPSHASTCTVSRNAWAACALWSGS